MLCFLTACTPSNNKTLDLKDFSISVPKDWNYNQANGVDSFVGEIKGTGVTLSFDFSGMGYANHLLLSEDGYLKRGEWYNGEAFFPNGDNVNPYALAKKIFSKPDEAQKLKFPKADYIATLTYKNTVVTIPVEIPREIKSQNIRIDSSGEYIIKTIWPKIVGKGMTGIYMQSRKSSLNFQMNGRNLSKKQQEQALAAFKTIRIKQKGRGEPLPF